MLNYIWAGMILLGVIYGVCTGQMSALTEGALDSAGEAVSLCITMAGVSGTVDGTHGDRAGIRHDHEDDKRYPAFSEIYVSKTSGRSSGGGIHSYESDRQRAGVGMGVYTGGTESHGAAGGTGEPTARNECVSCQQRNVYLFDPEYFVLTTDPGQHDRLSQPIRQCQPRGDHCSGTGGYTFQHHHFRDLL